MDTPKNVRVETDSFGPIEVDADRLWGAQTQRSLQNFKIGGERMPAALIRAVRAEAERLGITAGEAELVGLIPADALRGGPSPAALGIAGFTPGRIVDLLVPRRPEPA